MEKNTWRKIVEVLPGDLDLALEALAVSMGLEDDIFSGMDTEILEDAEYITAVPIELAFTSKEREIIMDKNPEIRYVVTKVQPERVGEMVACLDYDLITVDDYFDPEEEEEEIDEPVEIIDADSYYQIGGVTVKGDELYDIFEEDPKEDLYEEKAVEEEVESDEEDENPHEEETAVYKINGKEVSRDEFIDSIPSFLKFLVK